MNEIKVTNAEYKRLLKKLEEKERQIEELKLQPHIVYKQITSIMHIENNLAR